MIILKKLFLLFVFSLVSIVSSNFAIADNSQSSNSFSQGVSEPTLLTPDQAFKYQLKALDANTLAINFKVAPGYYLYRDRIIFKIQQQPLANIEFPAGEFKQDPNFGRMEVYHHDFSVRLNLPIPLDQIAQLELGYQGCSEQGVCYAPIKKIERFGKSTENIPVSLLASGKWWLIISGFFGLGLLLSLTPCVLPMIPILSGIIIGDKKVHHHTTSRLHAFNLSLAYTLGMALSYTLAGIAAAYSGQLISNSLQSPLVLSITAILLAVLALSTFGVFEIRLPNFIQNKLVSTANRFKGGQLISVFIMGILSALIVSPCVAAPLAGALIYISQTHDVMTGAIALFSMSIGMGIPLLMIGASAGHVLPKAGAWMELIRHLFGLMMLAVAILMLSSILPSYLLMLLWCLFFAIPAVYLFRLSFDSQLGQILKHIGIALTTGLSIIYFIASLSGASAVLNPLEKVIPLQQSNQQGLAWTKINSLTELNQVIQQSKGKPVLLDFYADWCVACKEMEKYTFSEPKVIKLMGQFTLVKADVTANSDEQVKLLQHFKLFGPPAIVFFNANGKEILNSRVIGFENADIFAKNIGKILEIGDSECNISVSC